MTHCFRFALLASAASLLPFSAASANIAPNTPLLAAKGAALAEDSAAEGFAAEGSGAEGSAAGAGDAENDPGRMIIVTGRADEYRTLQSNSATKTDTPLIDVPQTLSITSREQIDDQVFRDIGDVLRYTPGASIGQGEGHRDQVTIRGQNTTADFFIDGLRDDVQYFRSFYNLERVEVLKGSNALIFGRGGGGGVINRVTKTPNAGATFGGAQASIDSFGSFFINGDVNLAIGENAGFRLNAFYEELDNNRDFVDGRRFAVNPTVAAEIGSDTRLLLSYEYVDDDRVVDRGVPSVGGGALGAAVGPVRGLRDTFFGDPDANFATLQAHIVRSRIEHDFADNFTFNATAQYADYDKLYQNLFAVGSDIANGLVTLDGYRDTTTRENFIIQGNFIWQFDTGGISHQLLFGAEYGDQRTDNARLDNVFAANGDDQLEFAFNDPLQIPTFGFTDLSRQRDSDASFLSFYVQDQIDIGEHVKIVAGLRYDRFEIDVVDSIEVANGPADGNDGLLGRVDNEFSPRVGLIYKPQPNISLYASYALSFLPRSGDQFLTLTPTTETLAPEEFENYEIGAKWDVTDGLSFTAAIFRLNRENGVAVDPDDVGNSILTGTRTEGLELQVLGRPLPGWQVNLGYSYLDGEEFGRVVPGAAGPEFANRTLSQVPDHLFSLWNRYDPTDKLGFGLGVTHQSSQFTSISNAVRIPSFTRVDAAVYYDLNDNLQLQVNVENLFDENYFPAAHNDNNISIGEPINARFTVRARF